MNIVIRARQILHLRLAVASVSRRCVSKEAQAEVKIDRDTEAEESSDETVVKHSFLDPNWSKWWKGDLSDGPGKCKLPPVKLPKNFVDSALVYLSDFYAYHPKDKVLTICSKLCNMLEDRPLPMRSQDEKSFTPNKKPTKRDMFEFFYGKDDEVIKNEKLDSVKASAWKKIKYDRLISAAYLIGRTPAVYATTIRVLSEIKRRDPEFQPKAMLDYGSGTGTALWAAHSLWGKHLEDFFCVDSSVVMNELSQFLLTGGKENAEMTGIYLRTMLPASFKLEYDVVIAAYTLGELPSEKERLKTLKLLWEKTKNYLVIIDRGGQPGYRMMMEARNLVINGIEGANPGNTKRTNSKITKGHVFAPCPHSKPCPKWRLSTCQFSQMYHPPIYARKFSGSDSKTEKFTYMVLTKEKKEDLQWPRVISDPQHHRDKVTCHLCAPDGEIHHLLMKRGTHNGELRNAARVSRADDLLPCEWKQEGG